MKAVIALTYDVLTSFEVKGLGKSQQLRLHTR
jgi:hypothetical protein